MAFRFSISRKIGVGFGLFILAVAIVFYLTNDTLSVSSNINKKINDVYAPSVKVLEELDNYLIHAQQLMKQWAYVQRREDDHERTEAVELCERTIPDQLRRINSYATLWSSEQVKQKDALVKHIDELLATYKEVRQTLPDFDSYTDPINQMTADAYFIEGGIVPTSLEAARSKLRVMNAYQRDTMTAEIARMNASFEKLRMMMVNIAIGVLIAGILIGVLTSRSIVRPVNSLKSKLLNLSKGIYSVHNTKAGNDEIGDMAIAVNKLISNFEKTKEFSLNVGAGNFNAEFSPLSEHDELGKALIRMRNDLASYRNEMEEKVNAQTVEIRRQKEEVEQQRERVYELYSDLQSSIDYAQRLQETILPNDNFIRSMFPDSFVFFRPKATVSGDFYWFISKGSKKLFAAADCTGHGVPGAFMSLVGHNVLNQATKVYSKPGQVLNSANRLSAEAMRADSGEHFMKDGMDIALCCFDTDTMELEYSGAHNPVYIIRDNELIVLESDPFSIGTYVNGEREFTNHTFKLRDNDCIYLFSDGFADQFGGPRGKKFMRKQFREMLVKFNKLPMAEQKWRIAETLDQWKGDTEQIDDVLVIGVRV
jgi:serine phosphatase RsbU (regulator of sigma subunit)/HAMP domain-containing protein